MGRVVDRQPPLTPRSRRRRRRCSGAWRDSPRRAGPRHDSRPVLSAGFGRFGPVAGTERGDQAVRTRGRTASSAGTGATAPAPGGSRSSSSPASAWVTRATSSRSLPRRSVGTGGTDDGVVAVHPPGEVDADGKERRPRAHREHRRAAGQRRALAEELDLDCRRPGCPGRTTGRPPRCRPSARSVARPASGPSGTTFIPRSERHVDEPVEQLGRIDALDDHRHRDALVGQPPPGPVPSAEVGQGEDHAGAPVDAPR